MYIHSLLVDLLYQYHHFLLSVASVGRGSGCGVVAVWLQVWSKGGEHALCMASWGHERFGRRAKAWLDPRSIMPLWREVLDFRTMWVGPPEGASLCPVRCISRKRHVGCIAVDAGSSPDCDGRLIQAPVCVRGGVRRLRRR